MVAIFLKKLNFIFINIKSQYNFSKLILIYFFSLSASSNVLSKAHVQIIYRMQFSDLTYCK